MAVYIRSLAPQVQGRERLDKREICKNKEGAPIGEFKHNLSNHRTAILDPRSPPPVSVADYTQGQQGKETRTRPLRKGVASGSQGRVGRAKPNADPRKKNHRGCLPASSPTTHCCLSTQANRASGARESPRLQATFTEVTALKPGPPKFYPLQPKLFASEKKTQRELDPLPRKWKFPSPVKSGDSRAERR